MPSDVQAAAGDPESRSEIRRFGKTAATFGAGLVIIVAMTEGALAVRTEHSHGRFLVGREVYLAKELAQQGDDRVHALYLGDSVARQIYAQGDVQKGVKSLTTNQAISVEGQYYLLRDALATHRRVTDVVLFYSPMSFKNNLDQIFTSDYFCGNFHRPDEIRDAFRETHDWSFLAAHVGRAIVPNLMATNSWMNQSQGPLGAPVRPETVQPVPVSQVSWDFLGAMHRLCASRGIRLHVHSTPASDRFVYRDDRHVYDSPILYVPHGWFLPDALHLQPAYLDHARRLLDEHLCSAPPGRPRCNSSGE